MYSLDVDPQCFVLGPTSDAIASELDNGEKSSSMTTASLVLVDRVYDLVATSRVVRDNFVDNLLEVFGNTSESGVELSANVQTCDILYNMESSTISDTLLLGKPNEEIELFSSLVLKKAKHAQDDIRKELLEIAAMESSMKLNMKVVSNKNIKPLLDCFVEDPTNSDIILQYRNVLAYAAAQAKFEERYDDYFMNIEEITKYMVSHAQMDPLGYILDYIKSEDMPVNFIMDLVILSLSINSEYPSDSRLDEFKNTVISTLLNKPQRHPMPWLGYLEDEIASLVNKKLNNEDIDEYEQQRLQLELVDKMDILIDNLKYIYKVRSGLTDYKNLVNNNGTYQPLLKQIIRDIFNDRKTLTDLKLKENSSLVSGLRNFGFIQSKPKPSSNSTIILFVVGGITCEEISAIKELVPETTNFIIGSTCLITSQRTKQHLSGSFNY
eukprot:TRINITY_DN1106_c0_g1_i2.p1 TRINITY_DN1106_c0_g1~~TRINITY_DN1106_c0_g1_i2.p1  ORF type:complete len:438 (-),score=91.14 TRINITY_DN1106_c0_g1_i2:34-1347(-)